jgi:hypothetical protein
MTAMDDLRFFFACRCTLLGALNLIDGAVAMSHVFFPLIHSIRQTVFVNFRSYGVATWRNRDIFHIMPGEGGCYLLQTSVFRFLMAPSGAMAALIDFMGMYSFASSMHLDALSMPMATA